MYYQIRIPFTDPRISMYDSLEDDGPPSGYTEHDYTTMCFKPDFLEYILSLVRIVDARYDCEINTNIPDKYTESMIIFIEGTEENIMMLKLTI